MSCNLLFPIIHCLLKNRSCKADSFVHLLESFRYIPRAIKVASIWFSFTFTVKSYKPVVLWWRDLISQSKFKDDIKSKYWWCSKCYPEDREGECSFQSKSWCLFKNLLAVNWNMETCIPLSKMTFFLRKSKSVGGTIWQ